MQTHATLDQSGGSVPLPRVGGALSAHCQQYRGDAASMSTAAKWGKSRRLDLRPGRHHAHRADRSSAVRSGSQPAGLRTTSTHPIARGISRRFTLSLTFRLRCAQKAPYQGRPSIVCPVRTQFDRSTPSRSRTGATSSGIARRSCWVTTERGDLARGSQIPLISVSIARPRE